MPDQQAPDPPQLPPAKGHGRLLRASGVTGSMTLVSRVLGLVRDVVIARVFGVGDGTDAFFLANRIPNFLRRLFAEGAFNQAFSALILLFRRLLCRAALFFLTIPLSAMRSITGTALL